MHSQEAKHNLCMYIMSRIINKFQNITQFTDDILEQTDLHKYSNKSLDKEQ